MKVAQGKIQGAKPETFSFQSQMFKTARYLNSRYNVYMKITYCLTFKNV